MPDGKEHEMSHRRILCVGGPTGSGKDTVLKAFLHDHPEFIRVPRCTTRPTRPGEVDGEDYHFLTRADFERRRNRGEICAVDDYCGNLYGVDVAEILALMRTGRKIVGVFGVCSIKLRQLLNGHTYLVYITASLEKLAERLRLRGHPEEQIEQRLAAARRQLELEPDQFDRIIVNDSTPDLAVQELATVAFTHCV